jgi:hypothetical protein
MAISKVNIYANAGVLKVEIIKNFVGHDCSIQCCFAGKIWIHVWSVATSAYKLIFFSYFYANSLSEWQNH